MWPSPILGKHSNLVDYFLLWLHPKHHPDMTLVPIKEAITKFENFTFVENWIWESGYQKDLFTKAIHDQKILCGDKGKSEEWNKIIINKMQQTEFGKKRKR